MIDQIVKIASEIEEKIIAYRRDFHHFAEVGWTEFRTASLVASRLEDLGYQVILGRDVIAENERMGLPAPEVLDTCWQRARAQGGVESYLGQMRGGFTGVVGVLGRGNGPTIALRFDMDALDLDESDSQQHRPAREGFASVNAGAMHACGHDAHAAIGLGVAEVLARMQDQIQGTVKLIFQPAEEGVRGAKSMVAAGVVDQVDYLLGHHLYSGWPVGDLSGGTGGYLATSKFDAYLSGAPAHAAAHPEAGRNALLAAATAVLNLHAIPRHRGGHTRVNVGRLTAGGGRNVIPAHAHLVIETRGESTELNDSMRQAAYRILEAAAAMYACELEIVAMGGAESADSDPLLAEWVEKAAGELQGFNLRRSKGGGGSEDFTYMMTRVQQSGGLASNLGVGANLGGWGHHTAEFDIDESIFANVIQLFSLVVLRLMNEGIDVGPSD